MKKNIQNKFAEKIAKKIKPFQLKIELLLLLFLLIGLIVKQATQAIDSPLIVISLSSFAVLYFFISFYRPDIKANAFLLFLNKQINISFSIASLAILFLIQSYQGASTMMLVGLSSMLFAFIGLIVMKLKSEEKDKLIDLNFIRAALFFFIIAVLYLSGGVGQYLM